MEYSSITLKEILNDNNDNYLVLPNFQRNYVWDSKKQKTLLASFLLGLPIGNVLILKGTNNDFAARRLCYQDSAYPEKECKYLLDGQQRISTLKGILSDLFNESYKWEELLGGMLPYHLRYRWFIKVPPVCENHNEVLDILGYENLRFDKSKFLSLEPEDLLSSFHCEIIFKKNRNKWFHPGFSIDTSNNSQDYTKQLRIKVSKSATQSGLVPLYELYSDNGHKLHKMVLNRIAGERLDDLKELITEQSSLIEILEHVEPDIESLIKEGDGERIREAWVKLKVNWVSEVSTFLESKLDHQIAQILLPKEEQNRAFAIFETINKGGTPLSDYDLVVARAARNTSLKNLSVRIVEMTSKHIDTSVKSLIHKTLKKPPKKLSTEHLGLYQNNEPSLFFKNQYLNLLSVLSHRKYGSPEEIEISDLKRSQRLELTCEQINNNTEKTIHALRKAISFLVIRCGISKLSDIPYKLMVLPIAYCFNDQKIWKDEKKHDLIEYWYWASIFGGYYRDNQNSVARNDIRKLYLTLIGKDEGFKDRYEYIFNAQKYSDFNSLNNSPEEEDILVSSALSKAILQYILSTQPRDFLAGEFRLSSWEINSEVKYPDEEELRTLKLHNHHIFPLGAAISIFDTSKELRENPNHRLNSILNKTYISDFSNRKIRDKNPIDYFDYINKAAQYGHGVPTPISDYYVKDKFDKIDKFYNSVLKKRFDELEKIVKNELSNLI